MSHSDRSKTRNKKNKKKKKKTVAGTTARGFADVSTANSLIFLQELQNRQQASLYKLVPSEFQIM